MKYQKNYNDLKEKYPIWESILDFTLFTATVFVIFALIIALT